MNNSVEVEIVLLEPTRSKIMLNPIAHLRDVEEGKSYLFVVVRGNSEQDNSTLMQAEILGDLSALGKLDINIGGKDAANVTNCLIGDCITKEGNYVVVEFGDRRQTFTIDDDGNIDSPTIN